jgi:hypothetical protein
MTFEMSHQATSEVSVLLHLVHVLGPTRQSLLEKKRIRKCQHVCAYADMSIHECVHLHECEYLHECVYGSIPCERSKCATWLECRSKTVDGQLGHLELAPVR